MGSMLQYFDYYVLNFKEKRKNFLKSLLNISDFEIEKIPLKDPIAIYCAKSFEGHKDFWVNSYPKFKVNTILNENEETPEESFDGWNFNPAWNNRDILLQEGVIEVEKGNDFVFNLKATYDICLSLIKYKIHFAVFYAEGMRSPHIHIYDLFPDVEDWAEKNMAMSIFCRKVVPMEYYAFLDRNLWEPHKIALEFAKHWRTGHIKKILFEHIPRGAIK